MKLVRTFWARKDKDTKAYYSCQVSAIESKVLEFVDEAAARKSLAQRTPLSYTQIVKIDVTETECFEEA